MSELLPQEITTKQTYDLLAPTWALEHSTGGFWSEEMKRFHELLPSGSLLEIGAGGARDAKELVALGYEYTGTDVSTGLLEVARQKLPGYEFVEQSVYDLDLPQAPFDGFWASAILLHIPRARIDEALNGIKKMMKQKAIGFISIKDGDGEGMEVDEVGGEKLNRFFCRWSKDEFTEVLAQNGYSVVDYMYRPMSDKTKWHSFFVEVSRGKSQP